MKVIVYTLSFIICFSVFPEKLDAQLSTKGTDFWLSFGQNRTYTYLSVNLQYRIVAEEACTVTFQYIYNSSRNHTMTLAAGQVENYVLDNAHKAAVYPDGSGYHDKMERKSVHITSTAPIYVYAMNQVNITTDATNVLPVTCLGTEYYHVSYLSGQQYRDGYTIVATENNTTFRENGMAVATLQKGEVYYRWPTTFRDTDKTGIYITANKPVAYFVTNSGVFLPQYLTNGADILYQQLMPVSKWGRKFMVPVTHRGVVRTRVLASQSGTTVNFFGGIVREDNLGFSKPVLPAPPPYTLNAGEFIEIHTALAGDSLSVNPSNGTFIEADKPVAVCSYIMGRDYQFVDDGNDLPSSDKGDPSMVWIPPVEQAVKTVLTAPFLPTGLSEIDVHHGLIMAPTAYKHLTTLKVNGTAQALTGIWYDHPKGYSFYNYKFDETKSGWRYLFENPWGITFLNYGFGSFESYYYFTGSAAIDLDASFYYKNPSISDSIHHQELNGKTFCDTVANFCASILYSQPQYLKWFIDGIEQPAVHNQLSWWTTSLLPGVHTVKIEAMGVNGEVKTVSSTFTISQPEITKITDMICIGDGKYNLNGFDTVPQQPGIIFDTLYLKNQHNCDSIVALELTVLPVYDTTIIDTVCLYSRYNKNGFDTIPAVVAPIFLDTILYTATGHCDSIVRLQLTVLPVNNIEIKDTICFGSGYNLYGFDTVPQQAGIIFDTLYLKNQHNCDSIVRLRLTVLPVYDIMIKDTICLGERYTDHVYTFLDTMPTVAAPVVFDTTLYTATGHCDSIVRLRLTVLPVYDIMIKDTVCLGERYTNSSYLFLDTMPTVAAPVVFDTTLYTSTGHCDSIVRLRLTVLPVYDIMIKDTVCLGERYTNPVYTFLDTTPTVATPVVFDTTLYTSTGHCDSIVRLRLTVLPVYDIMIKDTVCLGERYTNPVYTFLDTTPTVATPVVF
ncbi:MAG: IgGFc-binding protein, partial [Prevotellaceae bacterium]|nr:IgGFc-binding protein [Prevotellaceae bacterium]